MTKITTFIILFTALVSGMETDEVLRLADEMNMSPPRFKSPQIDRDESGKIINVSPAKLGTLENSRASEIPKPGLYVVLLEGTIVTEGSSIKNHKEVRKLREGEIVSITKVIYVQNEARIRGFVANTDREGRIADGWISMQNTSNNFSWVKPKIMKDLDEAEFEKRVNQLLKHTKQNVFTNLDVERCNKCWEKGIYKPVHGYGLCKSCWKKLLSEYTERNAIGFCKECIVERKEKKPVHKYNLCRDCCWEEEKIKNVDKKVCKECIQRQEWKPAYSSGRCRECCRANLKRKNNKNFHDTFCEECIKRGEKNVVHFRNLCACCYRADVKKRGEVRNVDKFRKECIQTGKIDVVFCNENKTSKRKRKSYKDKQKIGRVRGTN